MKKIFSFVVALSFTLGVFCNSPKDFVCLVTGKLSEGNRQLLQQYQEKMSSSGYKELAEYIGHFLEDSFGSGFVYYSVEGKPFIVTNRHVVSEYDTVTVSFENEDGSVSEFKNLNIFAMDENVDVAIISLPENFTRPGLELDTSGLHDGDEVYSAGFPGLGDEPLWQLGKGIVSNSKARIKELLDPAISTLIQHTAEIDGGNSGGPLLIRNEKSASGYTVVGINTWKAVFRQNTNYAIPAKVVADFVEKNASGSAVINMDSRVNALVDTVMKDVDSFHEVTRFISKKMIADFGYEALKSVLERAPNEVRSYVVDSFAYNPLDGIRCSLAYCVWNSFRSAEGEYKMPIIGTPLANGNTYSVEFNPGTENSITSLWIQEDGQWKMNDFGGLKLAKKTEAEKEKKSKKKTSFYIENIGLMEISANYIHSLSLEKPGFNIQGALNLDYLNFGLFIQNQKVPYELDGWTFEESVTTMGPFLGLKIPMLIDSFIVEPFVYGRVGLVNFLNTFETNFNMITFGFGGGVNVGYETSLGFSPYLTVKYSFMPFALKDFDKTKISNHEIGIGLGFKFL